MTEYVNPLSDFLRNASDEEKKEVFDQVMDEACEMQKNWLDESFPVDFFRKKHESGKSPLRYPGGKTRARELLCSYFPDDMTEMVSVFLGGGSFELYMAARGVLVWGYDAWDDLVDFWNYALHHPKQLADMADESCPLPKNDYYVLRTLHEHLKKGTLDRAASFYSLNRASFGGCVGGGWSSDHTDGRKKVQKYTKDDIENLRNFSSGNLHHVECLPFQESLSLDMHKDHWLYLDPPYVMHTKSAANLYGNKGELHKNFDHVALAEILHTRDKWVLSYSDKPLVRELYSDCKIDAVSWKWSMGKLKDGDELIITPR